MYIYQLTEEDLNIIISHAVSKAPLWLTGNREDSYILEDGTLIFTNEKIVKEDGNENCAVLVAKNGDDLIRNLQTIVRDKIAYTEIAGIDHNSLKEILK